MKRSRLKPVSAKQAKRLREYSKLRKQYLQDHPRCECGCGRQSGDIHHREGRGSKTNEVGTWLAVCRECHQWIHAHANLAREKGWLV